MKLSNSRLTGSRKDKRNKRAFLHQLSRAVEDAFHMALTDWVKSKALALGMTPEDAQCYSQDGVLAQVEMQGEQDVERRGGLIIVKGPAISASLIRRDHLMEVEA